MTDPTSTIHKYTINTTLYSTSVHQNTVHKYKVKVNNQNSRLQVESQNKK